MVTEMVKVMLGSYDNIAKGIIHALRLQDDMSVHGAYIERPGYSAGDLAKKSIPAYTAEENMDMTEKEGFSPAGTIRDGILGADIFVDTTGKFDFSDDMNVISLSGSGKDPFCASSIYFESFGKNQLSILPPAELSSVRAAYPVMRDIGVEKANFVYHGAHNQNTSETGSVPIMRSMCQKSEKMIAEAGGFSKVKVMGLACRDAPDIAISGILELKDYATAGDIISIWDNTPRVKVVRDAGDMSIDDIGFFEDRPNGSVYETIVWEESIDVHEKALTFQAACQSRSVQVPDVIDAIRAAMKLQNDGLKSMIRTDESLNIW